MSFISSGTLIFPTPSYGVAELEQAKFTITNGTVSLNTTQVGGAASGYSEGTTVGTITGNAIVFRNTSGSLVAVGTANPLPITLQTTIAGEDITNDVMKVEQRFSYSHALAGAAGTTTVKSGAGFFHSLVVNKAVATGTLTIYDSAGTSSTVIAQIITGASLLSDPPFPAVYDVSFGTALTVAAAQAWDVTVSFR